MIELTDLTKVCGHGAEHTVVRAKSWLSLVQVEPGNALWRNV